MHTTVIFRRVALLALLSLLTSLPTVVHGDSLSFFFPLVQFTEIAYPSTVRVSLASDGTQPDDWSYSASISASGNLVAFMSDANNLVTGDTNSCRGPGYMISCTDVFVHDMATGETSRVSIASDGSQGDFHSGYPSVSGDGRLIAFASGAGNLVDGDNNIHCDYSGYSESSNCTDIFLHDRQTRETILVSVTSDGLQADHESWSPSLSRDGRFVAFESWANNLVPGDTNTDCYETPNYSYCVDVFVRDLENGETSLISRASDGTQGNNESSGASISADGRYVTFVSLADNLISDDTNGAADIFVHDRVTGETVRVSVSSEGEEGNGGSGSPSISADGQYIAFVSSANNLVPEDSNNAPDIFVHEWKKGNTVLVSVASDGTQGYDESWAPSLSGDGRFVAFVSGASNLVEDDANGEEDIFLRDLETMETTRVSVGSGGLEANHGSLEPAVSEDGRFIAFMSFTHNLVPGDTNGLPDIFVRDRGTVNER
jgi:Tol biopolymer transport system component